MKFHELPNGVIYEARAEDVYSLIEAGSVSLVHSDGPYAMNKAGWDRMKVADLAAWYRPHIEAWGRLCAPSASIYHWGMAEGWATVHSEYLRQGWTFKTLIVWQKVGAHPALIGALAAGSWPTITEVCGYYQRGDAYHANESGVSNVWAFDSTNGMRVSERLYTEETERHTGGSGRYYDCRKPLHPCQKPLKFADRMIRASSRPGDLILEPFGGTCRIAVACEQIARYQPADARRYICIEMNADGVDYIGPVLRQIEQNARQVTLFEHRS